MSTMLPPIDCRSPRADDWIRVKPGPESCFNTPVLRDPSSGELYLVVGQLWPRLSDRLAMVCPRLCANHDGEMFVWPVPTPTPGRGGADEAAGQYVVSTLKNDDAPPPTWPADDFLDVLHAAFRGRVIASEDHPLVPNWN